MQLSAAAPSVFFLMRMSRSPMRYQPRNPMLSMTRLPDLGDDEADHRTNDTAGNDARECRDLEVEQAARHNAAPHSGKHHTPGRGGPPERPEHTAADREPVQQR